jgi:hypothetical protein
MIGLQHLALTRKMVEISRENEVLKRRAADSDAAAAAACTELEGLRCNREADHVTTCAHCEVL